MEPQRPDPGDRSPRPGTAPVEMLRFAVAAVLAHRLRSLLSMVGISIGIASVILLTSIGEGTRRYILDQFTQFGTHLLVINPGKSNTIGIPGIFGGTTHKLTLEDALALERLATVEAVVPLAFAQGRVEAAGRGRSVFIYGVTPDLPRVWKFHVRHGSFWPSRDPRQGAFLTVLGPTLKRELFGNRNALGRRVRLAGSRFRVVGIMEPKGQMLGLDIDDAAYVPVATAMKIFNMDELTEIDVLYGPFSAATAESSVTEALIRRHGGHEDFTLTTQEAMLAVFGNVMDIITASVGAIAGVSLLVGAIGILTMMWIAVGERIAEIGLLRAVGATRRQVELVFLAEAAALALSGGALGVLGGLALCALLRTAVPGLPVATPTSFVLAALAVSLATGLASGVLPARRAAGLDPVEALRAE